MARVAFLLILLLVAQTIISCEASVHYTVISSPDDPCNETDLEKCLTISQFANNSNDYLMMNTTLHFLPGKQHLDSMILVENVNTLYMSSRDGNVTIVCNHSSPKFEFHNVSVVHISGLTIIGCAGNKFTNINQLILEDSQFIGHKDIKGTALELYETFATFTQTEFNHNYGSNVISLLCENNKGRYAHQDFVYSYYNNEDTEVSAMAGGAIVSTHSNVTIIDSTFEGNSAQAGGAIFAELQSNITIINSTFVGNQATSLQSHQYCYTGGGVLYSDSGSSVVVHNSTFEHNTAHWLGGVMATGRSTHIIIISNAAYHFGRVLSSGKYSSITITNSEFIGNSANYFGGVLDLSNADHSSITITDSEFANNIANYSGGVLDMSNADHSSITITDSEFTNNSANSFCGVLSIINADHSSITITDSEFTNNSANSFCGVLSIINADHSSITITDSEFTNNSANYFGGVLFLIDNKQLNMTITNSEFTGNKAYQGYGGVISVLDQTFTHIEYHNIIITISSCNFTNNSASRGGVVYHYGVHNNVSIAIVASMFVNNKAKSHGGTMYIHRGKFNISSSQFHHNVAHFGGVLWARQANISSHNTNLSHNRAYTDGGVLFSQESTAEIIGANFNHNRADNNGGTMYIDKTMTSITDCKFNHNTAGNDGGVMRSYLSIIDIQSESEYRNNSANSEGGVFHIGQTILTINQTSFTNSKAKDGGVIWTDQGVLKIIQSYFADNNASAGGVMWAEQTTVNTDGVNIMFNYANMGVVYLLESNSDWSGIWYSDNIGSLYALGGAITIENNSNFINNTQPISRHPLLKEGGAITAIQNEIKFNGKCLLSKGRAECGGALKAIESKVHVHGNVTVANNTATETGGGIHLYHSELTCWKNSALNIWNNTAIKKGGGMSAIGSVIKVKNPHVNQMFSSLHFDSNQAMNGGGLFLKMDSKLYIFKSKINTSKPITGHQRLISFSLNSALQYGGAIYVSDNGMCSISNELIVNECFIQTLAMYAPMTTDFDPDDTRCQNIDFVSNTADLSGNSLFGGLLDRCSVSQFAETNINNVNVDYTFSNGTMIVQGYDYFKKISNIEGTDIGSPPVRVCFCSDGQPNCSYKHDPIQVRKGQQSNISLSLAIVNQIHDPLQEATILSHFHSGNYICQNHIHSMEGSCTNLNFAVSSKNDTEELILSLDEGPCKDAPELKAKVMLEFYCPQCLVGFELDENEEGCLCICDSQLFPHFTNCSGETLIRERNVWIMNVTTNHTSYTHQYLIHPYCPFNYCHPPSSRVKINLNIPNGADAQCANHRAGLLCGTCKHNFSLSLGSSHCLPCSAHWYAILITILIAAILAGIVLVALLLALNLTVAIGTLNGIVFYANVVYANNTVFLPFTEPFNFITAFISWLNLEIGFDTCFFVGMDAYSKTLLQLAFPGYVFFLVFMVIIISKQSMRFSQLIGKRNPVATLATLISFSYAKFLYVIIASLSFAVLKYPDSSHTYVWLVDASVGYLSGKHIAVFIVTFLIIIAGVCYTALLLFWQWLLRYQDKPLFRWTKYQKLCHFIEPYHAPYVDKHRYWAGLLFLVRVVLYIVFALNVNGDPHVSLVAIILTIGGLLLAKGFLVKVYKKWPIDVMESIMYFNILGFAALTWYFIGAPQRQIAVVYTSVMITFLFLMMVIAFHVYKFTPLGSVKVFKVLAAKLLGHKKAEEVADQNPIEPEHREQEVSFSVVEVPKPILERPEPEVHIQLRPQELPCYTPANSLEEEESEMKDCNDK